MKSANGKSKTHFGSLNRFLAMALLVGSSASAMAGVTNFVAIDAPGSTRTRPTDVNNGGVIVGRFDDDAGVHGFVLDHGVYTTVDYPGAAQTVVLGINDGGQLVGRFILGGIEHGFLLTSGVFTQVDYPGAVDTQCHGINLAGQIVGRYLDGKNGGNGGGTGRQHEHGFVLTGGVFTSVDYPDSNTSDAWKISDAGDVVGDWSDNGALQSGSVHGYVLRDDQFVSHDVPGAIITASREMNAGQAVVGIYWDKKFTDHGFVLVGGSYSGFDYPGAAWTDGNAINDRGVIVGSYGDSSGAERGYAAVLDTN